MDIPGDMIEQKMGEWSSKPCGIFTVTTCVFLTFGYNYTILYII
jgi:hypothetical protein